MVIASVFAADAWAAERPVVGIAEASDGTRIVYDVRGNGDTALVFVHCWACDRTFWRNQADAFAERYKVVTLDLAGHGESGRDRKEWTVTGLAGDVEAVVRKLGLERVVLVGHSMGGPVSLAAAARMPKRVKAVIAIDTLHDAEAEFPEEQRNQIMAAFEADFEGSIDGFIPMMFRKDADPEMVAMVAKRSKAADRTAVLALMRAFADVDTAALLEDAGVPVRAINAAPAPPLQPATAIETNRKYADFDAVLIENVGHYIQLERPEELNALLRETLEDLGF